MQSIKSFLLASLRGGTNRAPPSVVSVQSDHRLLSSDPFPERHTRFREGTIYGGKLDP